jgi:hypothetical protein
MSPCTAWRFDDHDAHGIGQTIVRVPGSCSDAAAAAIPGPAPFMNTTHAGQLTELIARHFGHADLNPASARAL